ncbi:uncharacterized protein LOC115761029 [Drosophila novamexicana]|uniref:uncharacterized protein LOC115761029 n=1 Tax=Drosophila novamexicana TaxID=47314 RepID=UPI0011E5B298|nr:uncharacterized protein LOC115761029 [Drosophila novamexicana]
MCLRCSSRNARLGIAVLSLIVSMVVIVFVEGLQHKQDQLFMNHICLLQVFASLLLFVGSIKCNRWYFTPWLLIAAVFVYALVYKSLYYWFHILRYTKHSLLIISLLYTISGFWCYFINAVLQDFQEMRRNRKTNAHKYVYNQIVEIV